MADLAPEEPQPAVRLRAAQLRAAMSPVAATPAAPAGLERAERELAEREPAETAVLPRAVQRMPETVVQAAMPVTVAMPCRAKRSDMMVRTQVPKQ
jgi:hypothetical protein